jgi:hypothetical protein
VNHAFILLLLDDDLLVEIHYKGHTTPTCRCPMLRRYHSRWRLGKGDTPTYDRPRSR